MTNTENVQQVSKRDAGIAAHQADVAAQDAQYRTIVEQPTAIDWTQVGAN